MASDGQLQCQQEIRSGTRHFNLRLIGTGATQKTHPDMTEKLLTGWRNKSSIIKHFGSRLGPTSVLNPLNFSVVIMSPPFRVGRHIVFPRASVCLSVRLSVRLSVCLSVTNCVRSITWKPLKLYSRNFIQISISMRWRAECKNGNPAFYIFWVISLWSLCITKIVSAL